MKYKLNVGDNIYTIGFVVRINGVPEYTIGDLIGEESALSEADSNMISNLMMSYCPTESDVSLAKIGYQIRYATDDEKTSKDIAEYNEGKLMKVMMDVTNNICKIFNNTNRNPYV